MRMLLDTLAKTLRTLWAHKLRSFLTMFGIAWGVGSLLLLAGVGEGFRNGNRKQLNLRQEYYKLYAAGGSGCVRLVSFFDFPQFAITATKVSKVISEITPSEITQ